MYRLLVSDKLGQDGLDRLAAQVDIQTDVRLGLSKPELMEIIGEYDALIVRSGTKVDADVLAAGRRLKVVGRAGVGIDNIDIRAASLHGIIVMNTPQANAVATAEHTMALMLSASRHVVPAHASLAAGQWKRADFSGIQLYRKSLGIIGFGRIGRLVAARAAAFGMNVQAYDPFVAEEVARDLGVILVDLDVLVESSDFITLHTVTTPETTGMVDADLIARMKPGVTFINTARGKLVDEEALAAAVTSGHVRAAALDVFSSEPPAGSPLIGLPGVTHTPHLAASTVEAQRAVSTQIADQVADGLRGTDFRNAVNMPFQIGPESKETVPFMELAETIGTIQAALLTERIGQIQVEVRGETVERLVKPIAAALLKGLLEHALPDPVNYINAPILAEEHGISISQTKGIALSDYSNQITSKLIWKGGSLLVSGVLFGGSRPRIVQVDDYILDANPQGIVLIMQNHDVPGVIGKVGTVLGHSGVNIGEWRMGRRSPGDEALSFINLDQAPDKALLHALERIPAVTKVTLVNVEGSAPG